ncbi:MAG TPA: tetratricopeptide repeat protein [Pyrinomonadaceae bacterium]|nr:tetratricopeptide repeat protein [Pyrinomonadaceae bacterium]
MNRENLLFSIIGLLLGFIIGFIFASTLSQRNAPGVTPLAANQTLPPDHPPINQTGDAPQDPQQMIGQVQTAITKARSDPKDFDAQITAAKLEYQVQRYDEAVEFLLKANQIRPDDYDVLAMLGEANAEGGHYDQATTWYKAALAKKPGDISVLASIAFMQLQKGDAKEAEKAIANLEKADPSNQDLPQFKDRLASLKTAGK